MYEARLPAGLPPTTEEEAKRAVSAPHLNTNSPTKLKCGFGSDEIRLRTGSTTFAPPRFGSPVFFRVITSESLMITFR